MLQPRPRARKWREAATSRETGDWRAEKSDSVDL